MPCTCCVFSSSKPQSPSCLNTTQVRQELVQGTTSTLRNNTNLQPKQVAPGGLRGSLRNLTWKHSQTSDLGRRVFQKKLFAFKEPPIKEDWFDDFHWITREELDLPVQQPTVPFPQPVQRSPSPRSIRLSDSNIYSHPKYSAERPTRSSSPSQNCGALPPLQIPDSTITNRISTYTTRTITTSEGSLTPTFSEFSHIASSFPKPPTHIPIVPPPSALDSGYQSGIIIGLVTTFIV